MIVILYFSINFKNKQLDKLNFSNSTK